MRTLPKLLVAALLALLLTATGGYAQMREFVGANGQSLIAEIVSASGDQVTLRRSDNRTITTRISVFSPEDQKYIKDWQARARANRIPRLDINVDSGKSTRDARDISYDDKRQTFEFTVSITNTERDFDIQGCKGILFVFGKSVTNSSDLKLLDRQEFEVNIPATRTLTFKGKKLTNVYDDIDYKHGHRYNGYLLVVQNANDRIIATKGAPDTFSKYAANALKLKVEEECDRALRSKSEATDSSSVIVR